MATKLHISFILSSLWLSGGMRDIVEYANGLTAKGHQIALVTPKGTVDPDMVKEIDRNVHTVQARLLGTSSMGMLKKVALSWSLARALPPSDVIISTHTPTTPAGWLAHRLQPNAHLLWFYQDYREMFINRPMEDWLVRNALRWHKCALVLSEFSRQELRSFVPNDVRVVGLGLSHAEDFRPLPVQECQEGEKDRRTILYLGDMRPRKGLYDFLAAAEIVYQKFPDIFLWIVSKEECQIKADVPFQYIYRPARADLARLYASCDLFVSASWWESFGIPPLEAMACGAPVVMTDSRGGREYARPDQNCLMTPIRDPAALAQAMIELLQNPDLATSFRLNGPRTAARFTWEAAVTRFEKALMSLDQDG